MKYTQRQVKLFSPNVPLSYKALKGTIRPNISPPLPVGCPQSVSNFASDRTCRSYKLTPFLFKNRKKKKFSLFQSVNFSTFRIIGSTISSLKVI